MKIKNNIIRYLIFLLVTTILTATGCQTKDKQETPVLLSWDTLSYYQTTPIQEDNPKLGCFEQSYNLLIPRENDSLKKEICRVMLGQYALNNTPAQLLDSLALSNRTHEIQLSLDNLPNNFIEHLYSAIAYEDDTLVSMELHYSFANSKNNTPLDNTYYYNFALPNGVAIGENAIFVDGYEEPLTQLLTKHIENILKGKIINYDEIRPNGNFKISKEGITYCLSDRIIIQEPHKDLFVSIQWRELAPLLKENSSISHFIV